MEKIPVQDNSFEKEEVKEVEIGEQVAETVTSEPVSTEPKKKNKIIPLMTVLLFVMIGAIVALVMMRPWDQGGNNGEVSGEQNNNQTELLPVNVPVSELRLANNDLSEFDLAFLRMVGEGESRIYSPLSIKYALAMLKDGAEGESKAQIEGLIGDYVPKVYINNANRSLANGMFINTIFEQDVKASYRETLGLKYGAEVMLDTFSTPNNVNTWISDKTLGIINNMLTDDVVNEQLNFLLVNALAIDMEWTNRLQCSDGKVKCKPYSVKYVHEKYNDSISIIYSDDYHQMTFNGKEGVKSALVGASANRYDIVKELGEETIREKVREEYEKWVQENEAMGIRHDYVYSFDLDAYIAKLKENYGETDTSTDFYFDDTETEKVFAKDLREYDGATLQYVGIMPKTASLEDYIKALTAEKVKKLIAELGNAETRTYKEGVVTKVKAEIPFFKFDFKFDMNDVLMELGVKDVFSPETADLSNMIEFDKTIANKPFINVAMHKADIDFSNDGIKAAAVTAIGGMGAAGGPDFDYEWEVPVEEIDLSFDKPFVFLIRDKATGEVWFAGAVQEI